MRIEIKSPDLIELTPESHLEHVITTSGKWEVEIKKPDPLELNVDRMLLKRKEPNKGK